jgi:hypothetical protein
MALGTRIGCTLLALAGTAAAALAQAGVVPIDVYSLGRYRYDAPAAADAKAGKPFTTSIPPKIQALDGRRVALEGFMLPYNENRGLMRQFMLVGDYDNCSFGDPPTGLNDWVDVTLRGGRTSQFYERGVVVTGTLSVGEVFDADGFVLSLYRLDGEAVKPLAEAPVDSPGTAIHR